MKNWGRPACRRAGAIGRRRLARRGAFAFPGLQKNGQARAQTIKGRSKRHESSFKAHFEAQCINTSPNLLAGNQPLYLLVEGGREKNCTVLLPIRQWRQRPARHSAGRWPAFPTVRVILWLA